MTPSYSSCRSFADGRGFLPFEVPVAFEGFITTPQVSRYSAHSNWNALTWTLARSLGCHGLTPGARYAAARFPLA
jgi:hypothetical protein